MSHPYWPQPLYLFRPRHAGPVPAGPQLAGFGGYGDHRGRRMYSSLSPKTDWATPSYVRSEPSGLGCGPACMGLGAEPVQMVQMSPTLMLQSGLSPQLAQAGGSAACLGLDKLEGLAVIVLQKIVGESIYNSTPDSMKNAAKSFLHNKLQEVANLFWNKAVQLMNVFTGKEDFVNSIEIDLNAALGTLYIPDVPFMGNVHLMSILPSKTLAGLLYDYAKAKIDECAGAAACVPTPENNYCQAALDYGVGVKIGAAVPAGVPGGAPLNQPAYALVDNAYQVMPTIDPRVAAGGVQSKAQYSAKCTAAGGTPSFSSTRWQCTKAPTAPTAPASVAGGAGMALALAAGAVVLFKLLGK